MTLKQQIIEAFNEDITQQDLANRLGCAISHISITWKEVFTEEERLARKRKYYRASRLGTRNPNFGKKRETGPISDGKGYLLILKPDWYTGRKGGKHIFYHHYVLCEGLGITEIPKGWCVHHINGNKMDNRLSNLALLTTSAHTRLHQLSKVETHET